MHSNKTLYLAVAFVALTMIANILSLRMVSLGGIITDAGSLLYPLTFIARDALHRNGGLKTADRTITASALANVAMFALFAAAAALPYDPATGPQAEFGYVLLPGAMIVAASIAAQFVGERIDGRIFHRIYKDGEGSHTKAALASNLVSIPIDTAIFCAIAFGFTIPFESVVATFFTIAAIKYVVMFASVAVYGAVSSRGEKD